MYKPSTKNIKLDQRTIERIKFSIDKIKNWSGSNLLEICLFGSYATGRQKQYSSIDILVIVCESSERFIKRKVFLEKLLNEDQDDILPLIDPLVYTEDEIIELLNKKESYIDSVIDEAIVIWNDFNEIDLENLFGNNIIPSRYLNNRPKLESVI